jgi:hypothetical protein
MTDTQLYLSMGIPGIIVLVGILVNASMFVSLNSRMSALETRFQALENKFDTRFDLLMGKVIEIDNRLTRVEEQLKHLR